MGKTVFDFFNDIVDETFAEANKVTLPIDIIREEDGSSTIEVAVVGKTEDDLIVKGITENGKVFLTIESVDKELTEEEKTAEAKRVRKVHKIKGTGKLSIKVLIPEHLDLTKATKEVKNGLLTIKIPVAEESKQLEFTI